MKPPSFVSTDVRILKRCMGKEYFSVHRPWGEFACLCENENGITVKVIYVNKDQRLSLQKHKNRDQMYYIIDKMQIRFEDEHQ